MHVGHEFRCALGCIEIEGFMYMYLCDDAYLQEFLKYIIQEFFLQYLLSDTGPQSLKLLELCLLKYNQFVFVGVFQSV